MTRRLASILYAGATAILGVALGIVCLIVWEAFR